MIVEAGSNRFSFDSRAYKWASAIGAGIWLYLISPPSEIHFTAWIAYIPILLLVSQSGTKQSFWFGLLYGYVGNFLIFYWLVGTISTFSSIERIYALIIFSIYAIVLALPLAVFSMVASLCWRKLGKRWIFVVPATLVLVEYFSAFITLFPYQHGMSQFNNLPILQVSSITGNWGLSFLIIAVNTFLATLILEFLVGKKERSAHQLIKSLSNYALVLILILITVISFGIYQVNRIDKEVAKKPTITALQLQDKVSAKEWVDKEKDKYLRTQLSNYWYQQTESFDSSVDWILWPESSVNKNVEAKFHKQHLSNLAQKKGAFLSLGGTGRGKNKEGKSAIFNSVFNFSDQGKYLGRYDKQTLVPFSEYTPFADYFGYGNIAGNSSAGEQSNTFRIKDAEVAFPICYEAIFQSSYRDFSSADLMANLSNDIWFVNSEGRDLHAMISQIRAIEFGVPILRVGYTGLSFYLKPNGKKILELPPDSKQKRVIEIAYGKIPTFYGRFGDWFVLVCGIFIVYVISKRYLTK